MKYDMITRKQRMSKKSKMLSKSRQKLFVPVRGFDGSLRYIVGGVFTVRVK